MRANPRARASTGAEQCGTETVTVNAWPMTSLVRIQGAHICNLPKMSACSLHVEQFGRLAVHSTILGVHAWTRTKGAMLGLEPALSAVVRKK